VYRGYSIAQEDEPRGPLLSAREPCRAGLVSLLRAPAFSVANCLASLPVVGPTPRAVLARSPRRNVRLPALRSCCLYALPVVRPCPVLRRHESPDVAVDPSLPVQVEVGQFINDCRRPVCSSTTHAQAFQRLRQQLQSVHAPGV